MYRFLINRTVHKFSLMERDFTDKMSVDEIRKKFESPSVVMRFSDARTGQVATVDAVINLELLTETAARIAPHAKEVLDIGCGAGNYTLKLLAKLPGLNCTLVDLSSGMLEKATERLAPVASGKITIRQGDVRELEFHDDYFDIVMAGAVLHHLREEAEWKGVFRKLYKAIRPGGCLFISDLIVHSNPVVEKYMWERYEEYLKGQESPETFESIRNTIDKEDSPRPLGFQLALLAEVGFKHIDILHKNTLFASFGGIK